MNAVNPGNILPFYTKRRWQRHRQIGQDIIPFGLTASRNLLLPFQIYIDGGNVGTDVIVWELFDPYNDLTQVSLDAALLERSEKSDNSGYWITWKAEQSVDNPPDCGFWYVRLTVDGVQYFSEVLYLKNICGDDDATLSIVADSCTMGDGVFTISFQGNVYSPAGYTYSLQQYNLGYSEISDQELFEVELTTGDESADFQIQVVTACGLIMTRKYSATWEAGDPCGTFVLAYVALGSSDNTASVGNNPTWRIEATHNADKNNVLYQTGYTQWLYVNPIWDTPEAVREVETEVDGNNALTTTFSRTVERQKFEFADVPDYVLGFMAKIGDHSSVKLSETELGDYVTLTNATFDSRRQGFMLNIGILSFEAETEAFSGCQEAFELTA